MANGEALLIRMRLSDDDLGSVEDDNRVSELESMVERALAEKHAGHLDGHEFGGGWATVFCYGESTAELFAAATPALLQAAFRGGSFAVKRYGGPGSREEVVDLSAGAA